MATLTTTSGVRLVTTSGVVLVTDYDTGVEFHIHHVAAMTVGVVYLTAVRVGTVTVAATPIPATFGGR